MRVRSPLKRVRARHDHHAQREHPDEQQPDRRVARQARAAPHHRDAGDHHGRADDRPADAGQAQQDRPGDARQHPVGQGVADERQPAQHDEGADDRARDGHEAAGEQRPQHELVVDEGVEQRVPRAPLARRRTPARGRGRPSRRMPHERGVRAVVGHRVGGDLHDAGAGLVADRLGHVLGRAELGEDRGHARRAHLVAQVGERVRRRLRLRAERRDDRARQLEAVAVGEVPHRLVAGHQRAPVRGHGREDPPHLTVEGGQARLLAAGGRRRVDAEVALQGGAERRHDRAHGDRVHPDVRVLAARPRRSPPTPRPSAPSRGPSP